MVRGVTSRDLKWKNAGAACGDATPVENPVDAAAAVAALKSMKSAGIGWLQDVAKCRVALFEGVLWAGKNSVTG